MKDFILELIDSNKKKWIVVNQIVDFINTVKLANQLLPNTKYIEVYLWLKTHINYSWGKASQRAHMLVVKCILPFGIGDAFYDQHM